MQYLNEKLRRDIRQHSISESPKEACGVIVSQGAEFKVISCQNVAAKPNERFIISNTEIDRISTLSTIVAYYHSHPEDWPMGEVDKMVSETIKLNSVVYRAKSESFEEYEPSGNPVPYLNRPFVLGSLDCLHLVIDYYERELNIHMEDIKHVYRNADWLNEPKILEELNHKNAPFLKDYFISNGFVEVSDLQEHDVILTTAYKFKCAIHCVIYLGRDEIMHHAAGRVSEKEKYTLSFKKRILHIMRHKALI